MWTLVKWYVFSADFGALLSTWTVGIALIAVCLLAPAWLPFNRFYLLVVGVCLMLGGVAFNWAFDLGQSHMARQLAAKDAAAIQRRDEGEREVLACNDGLDWDAVNDRCDPGRFDRLQKEGGQR
jgi:hypothetical protein